MERICTTIEQSKKLIELGIDRKTSDLYYWCGSDLRIGGYKAQDEELDIPAWSLTALLSIIPKHIGDSVFRMDMGETDIALWFDDLSSGTVDEFLPDITKENFVDAAFETICWLKENGEI